MDITLVFLSGIYFKKGYSSATLIWDEKIYTSSQGVTLNFQQVIYTSSQGVTLNFQQVDFYLSSLLSRRGY